MSVGGRALGVDDCKGWEARVLYIVLKPGEAVFEAPRYSEDCRVGIRRKFASLNARGGAAEARLCRLWLE